MKTSKYFGITYKLGSNAKENWDLLSYASEENPQWIWFHLDDYSSPYVIMECSLSELESKIRENVNFPSIMLFKYYGGMICQTNSNKQYRNIKRIKILWTEVKNVSRGHITGEADINGIHNVFRLKNI